MHERTCPPTKDGTVSHRALMDMLRRGYEHQWTYPECNDDDPDYKPQTNGEVGQGLSQPWFAGPDNCYCSNTGIFNPKDGGNDKLLYVMLNVLTDSIMNRNKCMDMTRCIFRDISLEEKHITRFS